MKRAKTYLNNDERLGDLIYFVMNDIIHVYRINGWDLYDTPKGIRRMTDKEIAIDVLENHDVEEVKSGILKEQK